MTTLLFVLLVAGLGGLGSVLRMFLARFSGALPWGILIANTVASAVAGLFLFEPTHSVSYLFLVAGFAGGLSTFSSWAAQTGSYLKARQYRKATYNAALNLLLPAAAVVSSALFAYTLLK